MAEETFQAILMGIQILGELYALLSEPSAAGAVLLDCLSKLDACDIATAAEKARLVPFDGRDLPEDHWRSYLMARPRLQSRIGSYCQAVEGPLARTAFELKPEELLGGNSNACMHEVRQTPGVRRARTVSSLSIEEI